MSILQDIQSNIRYRVQSARAMLMGGDKMESASPIDRRREIMERRREALVGSSASLSAGLFSRGNRDSGSSSSEVNGVNIKRKASDRQGARRLNQERERQQQTRENQRHITSSTTRMSNVSRGTARDPSERSFN